MMDEKIRLRWEQSSVRQRPIPGPSHSRVQVALEVLIQRAGAAGDESGSKNRVKQQKQIETVAGSHVETNGGRNQYEERDARLREFGKVPNACSITIPAVYDSLGNTHTAFL
jgi:hypothetical protein